MSREQKRTRRRTRPAPRTAPQTAERNKNPDCLTRRRARQETRRRHIDEMKRMGKRPAKNRHETPHEMTKRDGGTRRTERVRKNDPPRRQRMTQENELTRTAHLLRPQSDTEKSNGSQSETRGRDGGTDRQIAPPTRRGLSPHATSDTTTPPRTETIRATQTRERERRQEASRARDEKESQMPAAHRRR